MRTDDGVMIPGKQNESNPGKWTCGKRIERKKEKK
jgi:hypothetical protein